MRNRTVELWNERSSTAEVGQDVHSLGGQEQSMPSEPTFSADALLDQLRGRFEQLCQDVAAAVNAAPAGQVINGSEEQVRDLLADFRQATY
jgi:hypothetical protein